MPASKPLVKTFEAMLERGSNNLGWTIIRVPLDVGKVWGSRGHLRVSGEINGFPFRSALFPTRHGYHMLLVNKKMQKGANARLGMKARFRMQPDTAPREIALPQELLRVLNESRRLRKYFDSFTPSQRQDIARRIAEGKHSETRRRRALQFAERLMLAMEAERELPPLIERALAQNPLARQGWMLMPAGHRRHHLLGIFYYRNPESRDRRLARSLEEMVQYAEKREARGAKGICDL